MDELEEILETRIELQLELLEELLVLLLLNQRVHLLSALLGGAGGWLEGRSPHVWGVGTSTCSLRFCM